MNEPARKLTFTFPEYLAQERAGETKHELINGEIYEVAQTHLGCGVPPCRCSPLERALRAGLDIARDRLGLNAIVPRGALA